MTQWYENNPELLELEKALMNKHYPQFVLEKLDDGRLYWVGEIESPLNPKWKHTLMVLYNSDHPSWLMGSSVNVYMFLPEEMNIYRHYLRPEDTPFELCAQTNMGINQLIYEAVWIHREECSRPAAKQLSLYLAWLFISECQMECNMRNIHWCSLTSIYPSLDTIVKSLIYAKI